MESKMINLKNDAWLGEDEETGEDEPAMTIENFRKRISSGNYLGRRGKSDSSGRVIWTACNADDWKR